MSRRPNPSRVCGRAHGFSLVELIVVMGVMAVLMAFLLPTLRQARQASARTLCATNLRQVGQALAIYCQENKQHLPYVIEPVVNSVTAQNHDANPFDIAANPLSLANVMKKFLPDRRIFYCPSAVLAYPSGETGMSYRVAAANNYDNIPRTEEQLLTPLSYNYSLKFLNGRKHRLQYVERVAVGGFPKNIMHYGVGPFYLLRDFIAHSSSTGENRSPHKDNYNQLRLDFSVSFEKDKNIGFNHP